MHKCPDNPQSQEISGNKIREAEKSLQYELESNIKTKGQFLDKNLVHHVQKVIL
jgi:hypothetical protein